MTNLVKRGRSTGNTGRFYGIRFLEIPQQLQAGVEFYVSDSNIKSIFFQTNRTTNLLVKKVTKNVFTMKKSHHKHRKSHLQEMGIQVDYRVLEF